MRPRRGRAGGFSLLELFVALGILILIAVIIGSMFDTTNECLSEVSRTTSSEIVLQRALRNMADEIRQAAAADIHIDTSPVTHDVLEITLPNRVVRYRLTVQNELERQVTIGNAATSTVLAGYVQGQNGDKGFTAAWSETRKTFLLTARLLIPGGGTQHVCRPFGLQVSPRL